VMSQGKIGLLLFGILVAVVIVTKPGGWRVLDRAESDGVTFVSDDDPAMSAAFGKAQTTLDSFLDLAASPPPNTDSFAVKVGISQGEQTEYFWISPFERTDASFSGRINNSPRVISSVKEGEEIRFERSDIVDWTYENTAEGRMYGNFTACALLSHESEEEAAEFKAHYGLECE
jgi:uncharacterized protein YegJ (DUF2314 family)